MNVFNNGQTYTIGAQMVGSGVATVTPAASKALHCGDSASFTVASACPGGTDTVSFTPDAAPPGIQDKLSGTTLDVTVATVDPSTCATPPPPPGGVNPAAPAVANLWLNANPKVDNTNVDIASVCKSHLGTKSWRGDLISSVASWMPKPESVKDTAFADSNDWILYVETEVKHLCALPGADYLSQADATAAGLPSYS